MPSLAAFTLCALLALSAVSVGLQLLRLALARPEVLPEEVALAGAWVFVVGGLLWLAVYLADATLLGFGAPWTWLAAAHFAIAGFGALTVTALTCRVTSSPRALRILRALLLAHPVAYLAIAAGISGHRAANYFGSTAYALIFATQLGATLLGKPSLLRRAPRMLLIVALSVPAWSMIPALAWAWSRPIFDLKGMAYYHGLVNALGHVGLALVAFAWGRPLSHSPVR